MQSDNDKSYINITDDGGVKKFITVSGEGENPTAGKEVEVHYEGSLLENGKIFDSSKIKGTPFRFVLGEGKVIKGWEIGVQTMKKVNQQNLFFLLNTHMEKRSWTRHPRKLHTNF